MNLKRIYLFLLIIITVQKTNAQINPPSLSNLHKITISTKEKTVKLDSLSLVPGSVVIEGVSPYYYKIDEVNASITWLDKPGKENVTVTYRVFPYKLNAVVRHYNYDSIRYNFLSNNSFTLKVGAKQTNPLTDFGNIKSEGSFGRGISFGNSQDAVVSRSLNLQLNGFIGDILVLTAAITANTIPVPPDGNTQDLSAFDRIFLLVQQQD